jgi:hypothetical protein
MTLLILAAAVGGFAVSLCALAILVLREVEAERLDLVNDARPCTRGVSFVK